MEPQEPRDSLCSHWVIFRKKELSWQMTVFVWLSCAIPIAIGFAIPVITLFTKSVLNNNTWEIQKLWAIVEQTVSLALMASCAACLLALLIGFGVRLQGLAQSGWLSGSISYAFPGTILAYRSSLATQFNRQCD